MASKVTLQTRGVSVDLKEKAEKRAEKDGFSSFQDVIRLFVKLYAENGFAGISWGAGLDKDVIKSIEDYKKGNTITLHENQKLSELD